MTGTLAPAAEGDAREPAAPRRRRKRDRDLVTIAVPALVAFVPLLLTQPGWVGADTKTYLYLDPGKLLADAPYVWDSQIGLGTVTHQNIGYLFPMGPFYWVLDAVGLPDWVAQRLWLGAVLFAAALGVRYLLGTIGWRPVALRRGGVLVASLAYMLSPYLLDYSARISVILLPWAALPWLIALTARSLRAGGWKYPALFAFVVLVVGGINFTALAMVGVGPLLWVLHAVVVDREVTPHRALAAVARIGALTAATSLWWIAGLWAEGRYGLPVLRYTESYRTVAQASTAPEVLRGLGYWFFYGNDKLGPWIEPSSEYTTRTALLALSYLLPIAAMVLAALVRWRYRAYFLALIVSGTVIAVGSHPWEAPSLLGRAFAAFTRTDTGLGLRSTPRAVPLVVLGTAVFLGVAVDTAARRLPRAAVPVTVVAVALILLNIPPIWNGTMVANNLKRPEELPDYWRRAAAYLDAQGPATRILEIPGSDFAAYRWGNTVDPVLPGLLSRPYVARELFTWGSPQSADLLIAYDRRLHEETMDPAAVATIARLLNAGVISVRSDMQYERYRTARPRLLWDLLRRAPGLDAPVTFGPATANRAGPQQPMLDEVELGIPPATPDPPALAALGVQGTRPIVGALPSARPLLVAGDGEGLVDAASMGLLDADQAVFYAASFAGDRAGFERVYGDGADLLVTDTNRKRARRWGALRENTGRTERAGETPATFDPTDQRLDVFPGAGDDSATVTEMRPAPGEAGPLIGATVTASDYGNPITFTPDDRPANALDGDPQTAWRVGAIAKVDGEWIAVDTDRPVTTDRVNLLQPVNLERTRWITRARLIFDEDASSAVDVALTDASRAESGVGQDVTFPERTFRRLRIEVLDTNIGDRPLFDGVSGVGFAEIRIPGVGAEELVRVPTDLLSAAGDDAADHALTYLFSRLRSNPAEPVRTDEEVALRRLFRVPTPRAFTVAAQARMSGYLRDDAVDRLIGLPDAPAGGVTASADVHLPGNLRQRASAAIDGDPATAWTSIYQRQSGHWIQFVAASPLRFDHLDLTVVADGRHSVPTSVRLLVDGEDLGPLAVPAITDDADAGSTTTVRVPLPRDVAGRTVRLVIDGVREVRTPEWYSSGDTVMPVSIAEVGIPGLHQAAAGDAAPFDSGCRDDLLAIDGAPVPLRVTGTVGDLLDRRALAVAPCEGVTPVALGAGDHVLRTGIGRDLGLDLDRVSLASPSPRPGPVRVTPDVTDATMGRVDAGATVDGHGAPFWMVLGQSWSPGWHATVDGHDLGPPTVIQGFANGWYVDPAVVGDGPVRIHMEWTPQRVVWICIALSAVGVLAAAALALRDRHRRAPPPVLPADPERPDLPDWRPPWREHAGGMSPRATAALAGGFVAVAAAVNLPTWWGAPLLAVPLGVATAWAVRRRARVGWLGLAAAASYALAAAYIVVQQRRHRFNANFVWPTLFERVHVLGLLAVALLAGVVVADVIGGCAASRRERTGEDAAPARAGNADPPSI